MDYKPTYEQMEAALVLAREALAELSGADNRNFTGKRCLRAFIEITATLNPPPPTYEEVTVERWTWGFGRTTFDTEAEAIKDANEGEPAYKLTGTRRVPVKQPVRKRVSVDARINSGFLAGHPSTCPDTGNPLFHDYPECHGKKVTLTAEWPEE